jgi:hypothetical protein
MHGWFLELFLSHFNEIYIEYVSWRKSFYKVIFNNISVISWRSVLLMDETGIPEKTTY